MIVLSPKKHKCICILVSMFPGIFVRIFKNNIKPIIVSDHSGLYLPWGSFASDLLCDIGN